MTLASLEAALREPFAPSDIKFLPKLPKNDRGNWTCIALPYADKRCYEDRLNQLAYGAWSTPASVPCVAGNKLIIPVTVVLCGVAHSDYGEAFLTSVSRKGEAREEEHSATEAYSQGFRRACAQLGLGRYLYSLPKARVPYDPATREIALSAQEKLHLVERLYRSAGLTVDGETTPRGAPLRSTDPAPVAPEPPMTGATESQMQRIQQYCQLFKKVPPKQETLTFEAAEALLERLARVYAQRKAAGLLSEDLPHEQPGAPADDPLVQEMHLSWLRRQVPDAAAQEAICQRFGLASLEQLRGSQFVLLVNDIFATTRVQASA